MKNVKIGTKIMVLVFIILLLMALSSYYSVYQMGKIGKGIKWIVEDGIPMNRIVTAIEADQLSEALWVERILQLAKMRGTRQFKIEYLNNAEKEFKKLCDSIDVSLAAGKALIHKESTSDDISEDDVKKTKEFENMLNSIDKEYHDYEIIVLDILDLINQGKSDEAAILSERLPKEKDDLDRVITQAIKKIGNFIEDTVVISGQDEKRDVRGISIFGVLSLLFGLIMGIVVTRSITRPLNIAVCVAERVACGDLSVNVPSDNRHDEIGNLTKSFRKMMDHLREQTREIVEGVNVLASAVSQISVTTTQMAKCFKETAALVGETTATTEEVRQISEISIQKTKHVTQSVQKTADISKSGQQAVEESISGMNLIKDHMESIALSIVKLSAQSQAIGEIITTVNDLAEQSNLLAVNAAIEASKAGEQGKGFSVVAREIRNLAEQSKEATKQVRKILNDISIATHDAVKATELGTRAVDDGVNQSAEAGASIQALAASVVEASQAYQQIEASTLQQMVGMDQVIFAIKNIRDSSTHNVESAYQLENATHDLDKVGQKLKELVVWYKV